MKPQEWLAEAQADQQRAQRSLAAEDWAGAAFHAQQCAEKALKGALWAHGFNSWGHDLRALLGRLVQSGLDPPAELVEHAQELEQHYFRSRYPGTSPEGPPSSIYTREIAEEAVRWAELALSFARSQVRSS